MRRASRGWQEPLCSRVLAPALSASRKPTPAAITQVDHDRVGRLRKRHHRQFLVNVGTDIGSSPLTAARYLTCQHRLTAEPPSKPASTSGS